MIFDVFIEPHERHEAIEAYRAWLTPEQDEQIKDAPEGAIIRLRKDARGVTIQIIEEGGQ